MAVLKPKIFWNTDRDPDQVHNWASIMRFVNKGVRNKTTIPTFANSKNVILTPLAFAIPIAIAIDDAPLLPHV